MQHKLVGSKGRNKMIKILIKIKNARKAENSINGNAANIIIYRTNTKTKE